MTTEDSTNDWYSYLKTLPNRELEGMLKGLGRDTERSGNNTYEMVKKILQRRAQGEAEE